MPKATEQYFYKSWLKIYDPSGIAVGNKNFINNLVILVNADNSYMWICPDRILLVRVGTMMAAPELLILQYDFID